MSGGDGLAASGARKITEQMDRTRAHHEARRPRVPKVVLTDAEKRSMGISNDRTIEKKRFKHQQILWLFFGALVLIVMLAQCIQMR